MKRLCSAICIYWILCSQTVSAGPPQPTIKPLVGAEEHASRADSKARLDRLSALPIGVFDSGTGGLTVLEQILLIDVADNETHALSEADGRPDFQDERFIFLADQANMPYGNYPTVGKASFLTRLTVKDAEFLLGNKFYPSAAAETPKPTKSPVKAIVIACNTATAYGKTAIERLLTKSAIDVPVVGVVQAGAQGALEQLSRAGRGTIGIMATKGTVLAGAYPAAIRSLTRKKGGETDIGVVQQGGLGLAGAIDGKAAFIALATDGRRVRNEYRGPSLDNPEARIDPPILKRYDFDFDGNNILFEGDIEDPSSIQLNSVENYVAYHVVSLMETLRQSQDPEPLRVVILGCTHFPFFADAFRREFARLYTYKEDGRFIYRHLMSEEIALVDPAFFVAKRLYQVLAIDSRYRQRRSPNQTGTGVEFFITVPCKDAAGAKLDSDGGFTYDYKYSRQPAHAWRDVRAVPLGPTNVSPVVMERLTQRVPLAWSLYREFRANNKKVAGPQ